MLSPVEDFWLRWHSEHSDVAIAEQARLVLEAEAGGSLGQVAASLGLSPQAVESVLAQFQQSGLATFPRPNLRLAQLIQLESADRTGCQAVSRLARRLFGLTRPLHHLPRKSRQLLEAAAWLSSPARSPAGNGVAQRSLDLLDGATLADHSAREQAAISCVLHFQRRGYRADRDPVFRRLRVGEQSQVRYLAALLQLAAALDHSNTQATILQAASLEAEAVMLWLTGPKADLDGEYACRQATLWQPVFHLALHYGIGPGPKSTSDQRSERSRTERGDEPVGEVFSRQMGAALRKWQASLPGAENTDVAGLGEWLAGVTEAQATLGAFASVLKRKPVKQVRGPLRELTGLLYAAIDQQNALSDLYAYCSGRPPAAVAELQPLRDAWERASRRQQMALRTWHESKSASELRAQLAELASSAPIRRRKGTSIRAAAPVLLDELYSDVAEREAAVMADRPKTYHRYQRSLSRLASALLALRSSAGVRASPLEETDRLLTDVQRLQNRIDRWLASKALNDALADFLDAWAEQQARRKAPQLFGAQAVLAYRQTRRAQWSRLRNSLPADWRPIRASRLRRRLDSLLKQFERP